MKGTKVTHIKLSTLIRKASRRKSTTADVTQDQSLDEGSSSADSNEIIEKKSEQLIPNLTFIAKNDDEQSNDRIPPPIAPRRILPSGSNNRSCSTEKQSKNNLNDLKKSQNTSNQKPLLTSHSTSSEMDDSKKSASDDNSIEEDIEEALPTASSSISSGKGSPKKMDNIAIKKRNLFDIDSENSKFNIDDEQLSGEGIAHHFFKLDESNKTQEENKKSKNIEVDVNSKTKLLEVSVKTKSIEGVNEAMVMKNLVQPSQSNNLTSSDKSLDQSFEKPSDKSISRGASSENRSTETISQEGESFSNSTIKSEAQIISDKRNLEKLEAKKQEKSGVSESILQRKNSSNTSNQSEEQTVSDNEKFEKSSTLQTKSEMSEDASNRKSISNASDQSEEQTISDIEKLLKTPEKTDTIKNLQRQSSSNVSNQSMKSTDSNNRNLENTSKIHHRKSEISENILQRNSNEKDKLDDQVVSGVKNLEKFLQISDTSEKTLNQPLVITTNSQHEDTSIADIVGPNESLTNQSTTNDVSELIEEISDHKAAQSLEFSNKLIDYDKQMPQNSKQSLNCPELPGITVQNERDQMDGNSSQSDTLKIDAQISNELIKNLNDEFKNDQVAKTDNTSNNFLTVPYVDDAARNSIPSMASSSQEDDMDELKEKILSIKLTPKSGAAGPHMARDVSYEQAEDQHIAIKQMEKVQIEFTKDILEDITEESEKISTAALEQLNRINDYDNNTSNDFDSIVSLNMIQMLENKIKDLQDVVTAKDVCLNSLNMQLDAAQRRESFATIESFRESYEKLPPSGRDSSSIATNSTEYRGLQEEVGNKIFDFHIEIAQRDHLIEKLTDSLQQSIQIREDHQIQIDKLNTELEILRKQMGELNRKPSLPPWTNRVDQESNGQRLSEISIDLVSESDEDLDRQFLTDNEDRNSRHSRERQFSTDLGQPAVSENFEQQPGSQMSISKQIEQFQKYLNTDELRIFFMVQKKFDDFLSQEIAKFKAKYDSEVKILADQMESEKHDRDLEITRLKQLLTSVKNGSTELIQLRQELDEIHAKEMEDLRTYFEKKCADLEKQYSEEIFSQQSLRNDIQSDVSDQENLPHDDSPRRDQILHKSKEVSVRKRTREELYASPSHRQMTPTAVSPERNLRKSLSVEDRVKIIDPQISVDESKTFYKEKIQELNDKHEKIVKNLNAKLKRYESKYADDEFMKKSDPTTSTSKTAQSAVIKAYAQPEQMSSYIIIDEDEIMNDGNEIEKIAAEYERRLVEQVQLAKEDLIKELEAQIQALLSETAAEDQHWPPELILLREKFTAKSQLEIAQLQIKHEEEMAHLKGKYEKQLNRKIKRQSTFDLSRDLDHIINERNSLRDLSLAFRHVTSELAKCISLCEDDFNSTFLEEFQRLSLTQRGQSTLTGDILNITDAGDNLDNSLINESILKKSLFETTLQKRLVPDVSSLLNVIDDPKLLLYITQSQDPNVTKSPTINLNSENFNLKDCIEKLKNEAQMLLELSEKLCQQKHLHDNDFSNIIHEEEKQDACEEDGLRSTKSPKKVLRANSMNENLLRTGSSEKQSIYLNHMLSLPPDLNKVIDFELNLEDYTTSSGGPVSELNFQVNELRNRLVKSEGDKLKLQQELDATIKRNTELGIELAALRDQLEHLDSNREDYSEGYGIGDIKSPQRIKNIKHSSSFTQLQEKARNLLGTPKRTTDSDILLQVIEDFCREGDKVIEDGKKDHEDLQGQIDAADKQLKATRLFLEEQAAERELERDDFVKEIEKLKNLLRDKDKERTSLQNVSNEAERMEYQIKELNGQIAEYESKKIKLEIELKASIDKIFVLREIISDLETQVETKALNEHVMNQKVKELESYTNEQNHSIEKLQQEIEVLKNEIGQGYQERITLLEDALRNSRPSNEQSSLLRQFGEQLRDISLTLEQKTKTLEALHQSVSSISCSGTPREDVSVQDRKKSISTEREQQFSAESLSSPSKGSPVHPTVLSPRHLSLPIEEIELIFERLAKHTRVEEAAVKRIKDLEMHINITRTAFGELQQERDVLQEKMSEQMVRISTLQTKLDEQKRRAEELQRTGSSDLNIRVQDLQNDLQNLSETLSARDKQILNLKNHLDQSKNIIDRQEAELAMGINSDRSNIEKLETELKQKNEENKKLREKIKSEMINKLALPDLMETMLADKNEEIDQLREQLEAKEKELQNLLELNSINNSSKDKDKTNSDNGAGEAKLSARTLSDIVSISEFDEPDIIRKAIPQQNTASPLVLQPPSDSHMPEQTMNTSKLGLANLTEKRTDDLTIFNSLPQPPTFNQPNFFATDPSLPGNISSVPSFGPRQINFSEFADETKLRESTPKQNSDSNNSSDADEQRSLKLKLNSARDEISDLKISLERISKEKTETVESLEKELEEKIKNLQDLGTEKIKLENQIAEFDTKIKKYTDLENEFKTKEEEFKRLENEFIQVQLKLGQCEDCLDEKTKDITNLEKQMNELRNENTQLKTRLEDFNSNNNAVNEIELLNAKIRKLSADNSSLQAKLDELNALNFTETIALLNNQVDILTETVEDKDEILKKYEVRFLDFEDKLKISEEKAKELENKISEMSSKNNNFIELEKLTEELNVARFNLSEKSICYERCLLDVKSLQSEIEKLKESLNEKDALIEKLNAESGKENINEIKKKLTSEKTRNSDLEKRLSGLELELEKIKCQQNSESLNKQMTLEEIAHQVERELNYSAQLDSNILKAIESEEETNLDFKTDSEKLMERDLFSQLQSIKEELEEHKTVSGQIIKQLQEEKKQSKILKEELNALKVNSDKIVAELNQEKIHSAEIQQQDSEIIDALRIRLEEVLQKEQELHKLLDDEREKCNRLATQISVFQHSEAKKASYLLKSPTESPKKSSGSPDFENSLIRRLKSEIELLTSQNKRERERMSDLQKLFEREKSRFESELKDHIDHGDSFKSKLERLVKEKDLADQEIEHLQEHSLLQTQEIESLTKRIVALQEAETRRVHRRDKERYESTQNLVDLQDLKSKLQTLEIERHHMNQTIELLRGDVERSAKREAQLAEAIASQSPDATIPQQFLGKMKEMNTLLKENMKELIDERKALQRKCEELETHLASSGSSALTNTNVELAERANHLLGRLLRVESHRKALVHQKRYLMISLQSYQESEAKAMALINGSDSILHPKRNLFKSVALSIIAIQRMKFIARRWQTGKRIVSKSVFTITHQKRAPLNTANYYNAAPISISPPCRDTNPPNLPTNATTAINLNSPPFQLQAPTLITECVSNQHHPHHLHQHQHQQMQPQKFDWSRLKK